MVANLETIGPDVLSQPLNNNFAALNSAKVEKSGDTMTGQLTLPSIALDRATAGNVEYWLRIAGVPKGVLFYDNTNGVMRLVLHNADGSGFRTTFTLEADRVVASRDLYVGSNLVHHAGNSPSSLGNTGYQRFPSGFIIQYGAVSNVQPNTVTSITFPIAFPTIARSVSAIVETTSSSVAVTCSNITATGCNIQHNDSAARTVRWIAVGN
jgi:hypothetical protein